MGVYGAREVSESFGERLLTVKEVGDVIGVSVRTVYRMIADGQLLPPVKVRGCSRIPSAELVSYLKRLKKDRGLC